MFCKYNTILINLKVLFFGFGIEILKGRAVVFNLDIFKTNCKVLKQKKQNISVRLFVGVAVPILIGRTCGLPDLNRDAITNAY